MSASLTGESYRVVLADDAPSALAVVADERPDLVVLEVDPIDRSGVEACRRLRLSGTMPILVVCSRAGVDAPEALFDAGADDFSAHGDRHRELVARARALLRRRMLDDPSLPNATITVGDVSLDPERHQVWVRGAEVTFPLKEFDLLALLLAHAGRVLTRATLVERIWGRQQPATGKTLEVHIGRLRAKIEEDPSVPTRILTVRGLGYRYYRPRDRALGAGSNTNRVGDDAKG